MSGQAEFKSWTLAFRRTICLAAVIGALVVIGQAGCHRSSAPGEVSLVPSVVQVTVQRGGPVVMRTPAAEFDILPSGYVQAYLLSDGRRLTLDEPDADAPPESVTVNGNVVDHFDLDFDHVRISRPQGKIGLRGRRVEITGRASAGSTPMTMTLAVAVYDKFPSVAITSAAFENAGTDAEHVDRVVHQQRRLDASLADPGVPPYQLWSFQGSSVAWGKNDVFEVSDHFSQDNPFGAPTPDGTGGGIPVVAFWTNAMGEAVGHIEPLPLTLSLPVKVAPDQRIDASLELDPNATLSPGEVFSTPRSFIAVYHGDFYKPLRLYSSILQRQGWTLPKPNAQDYQVSWCGWGYEANVTPAQMIGTIPKLKEFHIRWATLDDRWFNNYGDWNPRPDTFPGDSMQKLVQTFHQQGISVQIWWLPLAVEDGRGRYESHPYGIANVVKEHPDWLILDKDGKPARMARGLAALDPSLPQVQEYYRQLTKKFIQQWGFDGSKLDNAYSVPPCYNPKHHHKSPQDSVNAVGKVYQAIFETTRELKPQSVTQICSCGTTPNLAWLPYLDQAVTADPVGSVQVRRRIKIYKALLGPAAAVYGDHVELTAIRNANNGDEIDYGKDFASTLGPGGVLGTKFVWPDPGPHFKTVYLTPQKEAHWKKWIGLYNSKMLSDGTFLDLYVYGYDVPEGYAIEKGGSMYYAFYSPAPDRPWKGDVELRGLTSRGYHVVDYENGKDYGTVQGPQAKVPVDFTHHLLLEARPE
ncbi:MAG: alpha-galactosidase [Terriglobia bacterium]